MAPLPAFVQIHLSGQFSFFALQEGSYEKQRITVVFADFRNDGIGCFRSAGRCGGG